MSIKTVLGNISESEFGSALAHEHICCYSDYAYKMAGRKYLDKERLISVAVDYFRKLIDNYGIKTFLDCTPVNIGRDIEMYKQISEKSGMNIVCSSGFYFTEEILLYSTPAERVAEFIIEDTKKVNAGIIKYAFERPEPNGYDKKMLRACALAQLELGIPIVLHTNSTCKNSIKGLDILFDEGVNPRSVTAGHLSDTDDIDFVKQIAEFGCYIGFDRLTGDTSQEYIQKKVSNVLNLCEAGYEDQILFSHDDTFFKGFMSIPVFSENPRFTYCFDHILPKLPKDIAHKITHQNPLNMLKSGVL